MKKHLKISRKSYETVFSFQINASMPDPIVPTPPPIIPPPLTPINPEDIENPRFPIGGGGIQLPPPMAPYQPGGVSLRMLKVTIASELTVRIELGWGRGTEGGGCRLPPGDIQTALDNGADGLDELWHGTRDFDPVRGSPADTPCSIQEFTLGVYSQEDWNNALGNGFVPASPEPAWQRLFVLIGDGTDESPVMWVPPIGDGYDPQRSRMDEYYSITWSLEPMD
jgi:hypothetical protein